MPPRHARSLSLFSAMVAFAPLVANAQTFTSLYSFKGGRDGSFPQSGVIFDGSTLYGTTDSPKRQQTVFTVDANTGVESVLRTFHGNAVPNGLAYLKGNLYGTASYAKQEGSIFKVNLAKGSLNTLYRFTIDNEQADGAIPLGPLLYQDGVFYGTTATGGATERGTVFKFETKTRTLTILHSFGPPPDGATPIGPLIFNNGSLFGATGYGGSGTGVYQTGLGTVFEVDAVTGAEKILHVFKGPKKGDGAFPGSGVTYGAGMLYGVAAFGGAPCSPDECGVVFALDPKTKKETVLYAFTGGTDGMTPRGLIYANSMLYGAAESGGSGADGTLFKVDPSTGAESTIYTFHGQDGATPFGPLTYDGNAIYGTTSYGGSEGVGTVYKLIP